MVDRPELSTPPSASLPEGPPRKVQRAPSWTRVGPTFFVLFLAPLTGMLLTSWIQLAQYMAQEGAEFSDIQEWMEAQEWNLPRFFLAILPLHAAILAVTLFAASRSRRTFRERLGLVRPRLPSSGPLAGSLVLGHAAAGVSMVLAFLAALTYTLVFGQPSEEVIELNEMLGRQVGLPAAAVLLAVTLVPALSEELLYRGFAQTRLTERFGPGIAIAISSTLFAITHAEPMQIVVVLPVGFVFGYVRWRSSSIYPAMIAHALYNCAALEVMRMGARADEEPPMASSLLLLFITLGGLAMLPLVLAILRRTPKPASFRRWNGGVSATLGQDLCGDSVLEDHSTADHGESPEEQE